MKFGKKQKDYYIFTEVDPSSDIILPKRIPLNITYEKHYLEVMQGRQKFDFDKYTPGTLPIYREYIDNTELGAKIKEFLVRNASVFGVFVFKSKENVQNAESVAVDLLYVAVKQDIEFDLTWYSQEERKMPDGFDISEEVRFDEAKEYKFCAYSPHGISPLMPFQNTLSYYYDSLEDAKEGARERLSDLSVTEAAIFKMEKEDLEDFDDLFAEGKHIGTFVKDSLTCRVFCYPPNEMSSVYESFGGIYERTEERIKEVTVLRNSCHYKQNYPNLD